jgi:hypothetical protein
VIRHHLSLTRDHDAKPDQANGGCDAARTTWLIRSYLLLPKVVGIGSSPSCNLRALPDREGCGFLRNRGLSTGLQAARATPILPLQEREASTQGWVSHGRGLSS